MNQKSNNKNLIIALSIVSGILFIALVALASFMFVEWRTLRAENKQLSQMLAQSQNFEDNETTESVEEISQLPEGPKLVKKTENGEELVFNFDGNYDAFYRWENWVFQGDSAYGNEEKSAEVEAYNLVTGEKKTIFRLKDREEFSGQVTQYISGFQMFDNKLFILLGGYMMDGGIYFMGLNEGLTEELKFIGKAQNPRLEQAGDRFIVRAGEGDAGCSWSQYYTVSKNFDGLNKVLELSGCECSGGTYIESHEPGSSVYIIGEVRVDEDSKDACNESYYTQIFIQDLFKSQGVGSLINEDMMPEKITNVFVYDTVIFLKSADFDLYEFNRKTNKITKIMNLSEEMKKYELNNFAIYDYEAGDTSVCINENYELNLVTKQLTKLSQECFSFEQYEYPETVPDSVEKAIEYFKLPENFYYKD